MRNNIDVCKLQTDCTPTCGAGWCLSAWRVRLLWQAAATCNTRAEIERQSNGDAADDCETVQLRMRLGRARTWARAWPGQGNMPHNWWQSQRQRATLKRKLARCTADPKRRCRCCWCCCTYCCCCCCGNILQECCGISTERPVEACCMCIIKKNQVGLFEFCLLANVKHLRWPVGREGCHISSYPAPPPCPPGLTANCRYSWRAVAQK